MDNKRISLMFKEIRNMAENMGLTGVFKKDENRDSYIIKHYNSFLRSAKKNGLIENDELFNELDNDTSLAEVYISASLVSKFLAHESQKKERYHHEDEMRFNSRRHRNGDDN